MQSFSRWCSDNVQAILEARHRRLAARETACLAELTRMRAARSLDGTAASHAPHFVNKEFAP